MRRGRPFQPGRNENFWNYG